MPFPIGAEVFHYAPMDNLPVRMGHLRRKAHIQRFGPVHFGPHRACSRRKAPGRYGRHSGKSGLGLCRAGMCCCVRLLGQPCPQVGWRKMQENKCKKRLQSISAGKNNARRERSPRALRIIWHIFKIYAFFSLDKGFTTATVTKGVTMASGMPLNRMDVPNKYQITALFAAA